MLQDNDSPRRRAGDFSYTVSVEIGNDGPAERNRGFPADFSYTVSVCADAVASDEELSFAVTIYIRGYNGPVGDFGKFDLPFHGAGPQIAAEESTVILEDITSF